MLHIRGCCDPNDPQPWRLSPLAQFTVPRLKATQRYTARFVIPAPPVNDWWTFRLEIALNDPQTLKRLFGCFDLEGSMNMAQTMQFQFLLPDGSVAFTTEGRLGRDGTFDLSDMPSGFPIIAVKGAKWLKKILTDVPDKPLLTTLRAGEANNDNSVDFLDLDAIIRAYDTVSGARFFDPNTDITCDGSVDFLDLDIVIRNFDTMGDR